MGFRTFVSMNIAVIGSGTVVEGYANRYALAGHEVFIAWKDGDAIGVNTALEALDNIHICSIESAAEAADLIIIATDPADVREVSYWLGDVRRKVIIDATANLHTADNEPVKTVCAIRAITGSQQIVKVFSTRGYEQLLQPLFNHANVQLLLVGSSKKAKEITKILTRDLGVDLFFDLGDDSVIPLFNEMTAAWRKLSKNYAPAALPLHVSVKK